MYVESTGRAYDDWEDFLNKNKLPECNILYPDGGLYEVQKKIKLKENHFVFSWNPEVYLTCAMTFLGEVSFQVKLQR